MWRNTLIIIVLRTVVIINCQFTDCHDDPGFSPEEGPVEELQFTWLGALQYIHVKKGTPHYFRVPRVILISRQFVLSTAVDAAEIPDGYALGNVVFGDYERDEEECQVTAEEIAKGKECEPSILLMPIADVLLNPDYTRGAKKSIALMKMIIPVKSQYMLPACLPFKDFIVDKKTGKLTKEKLFHIDFSSDVPRDFIEEEKDVEYISILPRELCDIYGDAKAENSRRMTRNSTRMTRNRMACTTGCGFHSGAPTLVHEHTGHWSIVAISQGGPPCPDPMRPRRAPPPPHHIMIHPYVPWITAAISGRSVGSIEADDPFGIIVPRTTSTSDDILKHGWVGHWWMGGIRCYDRGAAAENTFKFYQEVFMVKPTVGMNTSVTLNIQIDAAHGTIVVCVKAHLPYRLGLPRVFDLDTDSVKVHILIRNVETTYRLGMEAWASKPTESESESSGSSSVASTEEDTELTTEEVTTEYTTEVVTTEHTTEEVTTEHTTEEITTEHTTEEVTVIPTTPRD